ncbi:MAG: 50S ribosomal protein L10 [Bacteroidales bacterium]|jgi:large subunit ribosomal protein L10|nr:50S ribosomal protein L10 [Bacteroidales bacterium]
MNTEQKVRVVEALAEKLQQYDVVYLADIGGFDAEKTSNFRRECFKQDIKLEVVKNTLLIKAMEKSGRDFGDLMTVAKGETSILFAETANAPARLIKEFRKKLGRNNEKPILKGAYAQESAYLGNDQLETLVNIKSKEELIGDVLGLLQSPAKNVLSALQSGGNTIAGLVKTLSERA